MTTPKTPDESINALVSNYLRMVEKTAPSAEQRDAARRAFARFGLERRPARRVRRRPASTSTAA